MAALAFGSPVGFTAVATTTTAHERRSLGERGSRVVRARLFSEDTIRNPCFMWCFKETGHVFIDINVSQF